MSAELVSVDSFYIDNLKGVGRVYQLAAVQAVITNNEPEYIATELRSSPAHGVRHVYPGPFAQPQRHGGTLPRHHPPVVC
jgi:hypothetical protein